MENRLPRVSPSDSGAGISGSEAPGQHGADRGAPAQNARACELVTHRRADRSGREFRRRQQLSDVQTSCVRDRLRVRHVLLSVHGGALVSGPHLCVQPPNGAGRRHRVPVRGQCSRPAVAHSHLVDVYVKIPTGRGHEQLQFSHLCNVIVCLQSCETRAQPGENLFICVNVLCQPLVLKVGFWGSPRVPEGDSKI